ncbi:MAG: hypothetical protein RI897_2348 [Verrucomicrobiota bacterium]
MEEFHGLLDGGIGPALGADLAHAVIFFGGGDEGCSFGDRVGDGFFDVDIFTGLHSPDTGERVPVVWGGCADDIDVIGIEGFPHVFDDLGCFALFFCD